MPADYPRPGAGSLQWNAGGWFGSQLGGTAWLLVGAAVLAWQAPAVAVVWLDAFVVTNAIGVWLWRCRARVRPYFAMQLLLLACGGSGLLACFLLGGGEVVADGLAPGVVVAATTSTGCVMMGS